VRLDVQHQPPFGRAVGDYRKNKALAALALKNLERENSLAAQRISPETDRVEAQMQYDTYRIEWAASENALAVMGADTETLAAETASTGALPVRAPRAGTVIGRQLVPGEPAETGKALLTIADLSSVWVWLDLHEQDVARVLDEARRGKPRVRISVGAFPGKTFDGTIDQIGATMDEASRTIRVRATLANPEGLLRPGMFCTAQMVSDLPETVLAVPAQAVLADEGQTFVFRRINDAFVLRTDVTVGRTFADSVEITSGLDADALIAVHGAFILKSDVLRAKMGAGCAD